jgi:hypothetical protein
MPARTPRKALSLIARSAELAVAVPQVVAHRKAVANAKRLARTRPR